MQMRSSFAALILSLVTSDACANVLISVDKNTQRMTISVDGAPRYQFAVSTGRAGYGTFSSFRCACLEKTHFCDRHHSASAPAALVSCLSIVAQT
jgi:hypothetical protein